MANPGRRLALVVATLVLPVAGCGSSPKPAPKPSAAAPLPTSTLAAGSTAACDDAVRPTGVLPATIARKLDAYGAPAKGQPVAKVVGTGGVWFAVPTGGSWSGLVNAGRGRLGLWTSGHAIPTVTVKRTTDDAAGEASSTTPAGLPGPVPTEVTLPATGCWRITASTPGGTAMVTLKRSS